MAFVKVQGVELVLRKTIGEIKSECTSNRREQTDENPLGN